MNRIKTLAALLIERSKSMGLMVMELRQNI